MRMKTSCVRSSAASAFEVNRYARLKIRREKPNTISSQATPSPARALRTRSAPLISTAAFKASKSVLSKRNASYEKQKRVDARLVNAVLRYQKIKSSNKVAARNFLRYELPCSRFVGGYSIVFYL